jgi:putative hemolysin
MHVVQRILKRLQRFDDCQGNDVRINDIYEHHANKGHIMNKSVFYAFSMALFLVGCDKPAPVIVQPSPPPSPPTVVVAPPTATDDTKVSADKAAEAAKDATRAAEKSKDASMDAKEAANKATDASKDMKK